MDFPDLAIFVDNNEGISSILFGVSQFYVWEHMGKTDNAWLDKYTPVYLSVVCNLILYNVWWPNSV